MDIGREGIIRIMIEEETPSWVRRLASKLGGEAGAWVLLKHARGPSLSAVQDAVAAANEAVPLGSTVGSFVTATPRGEAVLVHGNPDLERSTTQWLTALWRALEERGVSVQGSIMRSPRTGKDEAVELRGSRFPAVFIGYRMDRYRPLTQSFNGWQVDSDTTRRLAERYTTWLSSVENATISALAWTSAFVSLDEVAEFLCATAAISPFIKGATSAGPNGMPTLSVMLGQMGTTVIQGCDLTLTWAERVERQTVRMCADPDVMDVGLIWNANYVEVSWNGLGHRTEHIDDLPVRLPLDYERNRHLWDEYVIDAAGVQLLTGKHLKHATDLSNWIVDEVAPERFLVRARDLAPWYAGQVRDPDTVSRARRDFGDMILSWDAILANPGPYTVTDPIVVGR